MRTLGARAHLLLALAAATALIGSLRLPWHAAAPPAPAGEPELTARMEGWAAAVSRALGERGGAPGWDALGRIDLVLAGLSGAVILLLLLSLAPPLEEVGRGLARLCATGALGVVAYQLAASTAGSHEPRVGALAALGAALMLLTAVGALAAAPRRRSAPAPAYQPPPVRTYETNASWGPPQY